jgi:hypothetical protein
MKTYTIMLVVFDLLLRIKSCLRFPLLFRFAAKASQTLSAALLNYLSFQNYLS